MATTSEARALPFFTDLYGQPLEAGFIYIGQPGLDPVAYPQVITSDIAGNVAVAQPVRTTHGHAAAGGALIHLFVQIPYSITILDSSGRLVYASLNENDPIALAIGSSSVQSSSDLAGLRARSGPSTNQVWVDGFGMYVYSPIDNTSPENIPFVIVGNDGSRYHLSATEANIVFARISGVAPAPASQGCWVSWNDDAQGNTFLTNNHGTGSGGFVLRTVTADGVTILGKVAITSAGKLIADSDVQAQGNLISAGNVSGVNVSASGNVTATGSVTSNGLTSTGPAQIQGSSAVTVASLVNIINTQQVGAIILTANSTAPTQPGTWQSIALGLGSTGISQWLRTA